MSKYKLIAFDMDGTLLNSEKKISENTLQAIQKAIQAGKEVILSTGRCLPELIDYLDELPGIRYLDGISGAFLYDLKEDKLIASSMISEEIVTELIKIAKRKDIMFHLLTQESHVQANHSNNMARYHMEAYQDMYDRVAIKHDDLERFYQDHPFPVAKFNMYHLSIQDREDTKTALAKLNLPIVWVEADTTSLEVSIRGTNKGAGLLKLCEYLHIQPEEVIAVGDSDNDLDILKVAGLAVAMGNSKKGVKDIADVIVADCDHDGCAEAIEKYLL